MYYSKDSILFLNGKFIKAVDAHTDLYSQTLHYGFGAFEGIRAYDTLNGVKIFKAREHFDRLKNSCALVGIPFQYETEELIQIAYQLLRGREGMGLGDIKLAVSLGASAGWLGGVLAEGPSADLVAPSPVLAALSVTIYAVLAGNVLGAAVGGLLTRRVDREIPFGPALVAGWLVVVLLADRIV